MEPRLSNLEIVAREICGRRLSAAGTPVHELPAAVDRYWHCVAAELEAGSIDETGRLLRPFDFDADLAAYRDWCARHPNRM